MGNVCTLNLSQNGLTDHTLDLFLANMGQLQNLKNLILSQNKIMERKSKIKLDKLRKFELTVSV